MEVKKYYFKLTFENHRYGPYHAFRVEQAWEQHALRKYGTAELKWKDALKAWEYTIEK